MEDFTNTVENDLKLLKSTPSKLEKVLAGENFETISKRPLTNKWSALEIVCHLRDVEELFQIRFLTILALDKPQIFVLSASADELKPWKVGEEMRHPLDPDSWAEERQYARNDVYEALTAFAKRRNEVMNLLESLTTQEWQRVGVHLHKGEMSLARWVSGLAAHDVKHLAQLSNALEGHYENL